MFWSSAFLSSNIKHGNGSGFPLNIGGNPLIQQIRGHNISLYSRVVFPCCFLMCVLLCFLFCSPVHLQKNVVEKKCRKSWSESIEVWLQKPRISLKHPGGRLVSSFRPLRSLATFLSVPGLSDSIHLDVFGGFFLSENPHFPNKLTGRFLVGEVLTTWNYSEKMASQKERIIFEPPKLLWKEYVYPADFSFLWFDGGNLSKTWAVSLEMLFVFLEQWDVKPQFSGVWFLPSDLVFDVSFRWKTFAIWHWIWFCLHSKLSRCKRKIHRHMKAIRWCTFAAKSRSNTAAGATNFWRHNMHWKCLTGWWNGPSGFDFGFQEGNPPHIALKIHVHEILVVYTGLKK